jgi:molecular chaperone GrpE
MGDRDEPMGNPAEAGVTDQGSGEPVAAADAGVGTEAAGEARAEVSAETPESLQQRVATLEAELRERREDLLRERAEVENFKRRMQREKTEALRYALEPLVRDLLPVVDNLERALAHAETAAVVDGVKMVHKGLVDALTRGGVERVDSVGQPFDPNLHEAIAQVDSAECAPGAVVAQFQPGYRLHDRLVRPAMVTVNARKAEAPVATGQDSD